MGDCPHAMSCMCWLQYLQNPITGNTSYGTGNATCTGTVLFLVTLPVQVLQKQGYHTSKLTLLVLRRTIPVMYFFNDVIGNSEIS
jgi:hypothetical protein